MSKYTVTASEMSQAIRDLTSLNSEFKSRVAELEASQQELASMWQGEANTAFNTAFQNDKGNWDTFATLVDQYVETLSSVLTLYQNAEATNKETAKTRSF